MRNFGLSMEESDERGFRAVRGNEKWIRISDGEVEQVMTGSSYRSGDCGCRSDTLKASEDVQRHNIYKKEPEALMSI